LSARPYIESILVVDDTEFMVQTLVDIFSAEGYRVSSARSGSEAVELYEHLLPDLVTLDLVMPGMDGLATLSALREMDPAARIVVVSGTGLEDKVIDAVRQGARNYLLKPFDRDKVLETTRRVLDEY